MLPVITAFQYFYGTTSDSPWDVNSWPQIERFWKRKRGSRWSPFSTMAVGQGFEPREPLGSTVFKTAAFDHSASPPENCDLKNPACAKQARLYSDALLRQGLSSLCSRLLYRLRLRGAARVIDSPGHDSVARHSRWRNGVLEQYRMRRGDLYGSDWFR